MNKVKVTAIIPVKNEASSIGSCLERLERFDQVVVVDSNSNDGTEEIIKSFGYELLQFNWNGKYPKKRMWALNEINFRNEWVIFIDADELITPEFLNELEDKITHQDYDGYWLNYQNYFLNKKLNYGDKLKKLALFKRSKAIFKDTNEENWCTYDMEIHNHISVNGKVGHIQSEIIHKDFKSLHHYIDKHNVYSDWETNFFLSLKKTETLTQRQKIKYKLMEYGLLHWVYFIGAYIFKLGFLDGKEGYTLASLKSHYFFQIQSKILEHKRNQST